MSSLQLSMVIDRDIFVPSVVQHGISNKGAYYEKMG